MRGCHTVAVSSQPHTPSQPAAVLFDMDGTLIDSTPAVERSWVVWAQHYGVSAEDLAHSHGMPSASIVAKLIPEVMGREIEKSTQGIYPLKDVYIRKVKVLKRPKFDTNKLFELHGGASVVGAEDVGTKIKSGEFKEPVPQASV